MLTPTRGLVTAQGFRPLVTPPNAMQLVDADAEARLATEQIGRHIEWIEIAHNDILVLKYNPEKIGSILTSKATQTEGRYQNKCGLVLKFGPKSHEDGFKYNIGDWVYYRPSDGQEIGLRCENSPTIAMCLILSPAHIIGKVTNPDLIW